MHKTQTGGQTLVEAKHINVSLFFLEMVIVALRERGTKGRQGRSRDRASTRNDVPCCGWTQRVPFSVQNRYHLSLFGQKGLKPLHKKGIELFFLMFLCLSVDCQDQARPEFAFTAYFILRRSR